MNTAPLPRRHSAEQTVPTAADLVGDATGELLRNDDTTIDLRFDDACRYVGVSISTVDKVWEALADQLAAPDGYRECLWPNRLIAARAGVSISQARRSLRVLAAFELLDRQRRFNTSSVTGVSPSVSQLASPPAGRQARCDADGCTGCDLGDAQAALAESYGAQVWGASWARDISAALEIGWNSSDLVHELTANMGSVDSPQNHVRVARARLQEIIGTRGVRHLPHPEQGAARRPGALRGHPARTGRARTERAVTPQPVTAHSSSDTCGVTGRAGTEQVRSDERAPAKQPKQAKQDQPGRAPLDEQRAVTTAVWWGVDAIKINTSQMQAQRWVAAAVDRGLSPVDVRWGLFEGLSSVDSPHAVITWRLGCHDGLATIAANAAKFRERRRERALLRLSRMRRSEAEQAAAESAAHEKDLLAEAQARDDADLTGILGEAPAPPVRTLARMLPVLEIEFADGRVTDGLLLRRVREALTNKDHVIARQTAMIVSAPLAEHILGHNPVRVHHGPEPDSTSDGRLFSVE